MIEKEIKYILKNVSEKYEKMMSNLVDKKCKTLKEKLHDEAYEDLSMCYVEI